MMTALSLLCSFLAVFTLWLILPIFIFGPLAIYFGWKSYKRARARAPQMSLGRRLLALTPMLIAIATMPCAMMIISTGYRA